MAHSLILFILLAIFSSGGCAFLGLSGESSEDPYSEDYPGSEDEEEEEDEEEDYDDEEEDEEDYDEEGEEDYEDEEGEDEEEEGGGFFDWLFGSSDDEEDEEDEMGMGDDDGMEDETGDGMGDEMGDEGMDYDSSPEGEALYSPDEDTSYTDDGYTGGEGTNIGEDSGSAFSSPKKKKNIPLQKIQTSSYRKGGVLVNAVYIARQGESLRTVSSTIYGGADRTSELYKINPHLKLRDLKVGDKIYYNSPLRPEDNSKLLFYYRDINAESSFHSLSPGSNIRTESTKLLGHPNSWKEIWATNPDLISKGDIDRSLNIVYWPPGSTGPVAEQTAPPAEDPLTEDSVPEEDLAAFPPESPQAEEMEQEDSTPFPPPPPQQAGIETGDKSFPPPMPPSEKPKTDKQNLVQSLFEQKGIILILISIVVILILLIRLVLKKRKQRDFDYTATNIEV